MTTIDFNNYQLFNGGYRVYTIPSSARVLVQDPNGLWFMAENAAPKFTHSQSVPADDNGPACDFYTIARSTLDTLPHHDK